MPNSTSTAGCRRVLDLRRGKTATRLISPRSRTYRSSELIRAARSKSRQRIMGWHFITCHRCLRGALTRQRKRTIPTCRLRKSRMVCNFYARGDSLSFASNMSFPFQVTSNTHHTTIAAIFTFAAGYPGLPDFNASYCEHVSFHRCLGRVVIHRSLRSPVIGGLH